MPSLYNISETFQIENNVKVYNLDKCFHYLETIGKQIYGQSFKIHPQDKPIIYKLLIYAIRDEKNASENGINLNKGILLSGPIGCGKTSIMRLIKPFLYLKDDYKIKTCREISFEFAKNGFEALQPYTQKSNMQYRLTGFCFDDLGAEQQIKHFGNDCNVMAEILLSRYEEFITNQSITHITTNLNASEIEQLYGNRLRSRFRQMFNLLSFSQTSTDKR
ncbi:MULTISPECIES: ATP-binding protein [Flavobacterium]|uniref:ATP-binding protein n=1 Tax=Flavobacterium TaxID=237 RepID=UPI001FCB168D|nr:MULTISPECIES: ATP-binding protein [Flavobacterium]UOK43396.1 ATP-binding protein [Flavobacterium enshiense]